MRRTRQVAILSALTILGPLLGAAPAGAAPTWQPVSDLSAIGGAAVKVDLAVDAAGNATAVWVRDDGTHDIVQSATRPAGGAWSAPVDLSAPGADAVTPQVAVDPDGHATAVWERADADAYVRVQSAARPPGGAWSAPVDVSVTGGSARNAQVAVDAAGTATATWVRYDGTNRIVQTAQRARGGVWTGLVDLSATGQNAQEPDLAVNSSGAAIVAWSRSDGTDLIAQAATRDSSTGPWSGATSLSAPGAFGIHPDVAIDDAGRATAVWRRFDTVYVTQTATREPGGSWGSTSTLSTAGVPTYEATVATNGEGAMVVAWAERSGGAGTPVVLRAATRSAGMPWSTPVEVDQLGTGGSHEIEVVIDPDGTPTAVWRRINGGDTAIAAASLREGWTSPIVLSDPLRLSLIHI